MGSSLGSGDMRQARKKKSRFEDELCILSEEERIFIQEWTKGVSSRTRNKFIAMFLNIIDAYKGAMDAMHSRGRW